MSSIKIIFSALVFSLLTLAVLPCWAEGWCGVEEPDPSQEFAISPFLVVDLNPETRKPNLWSFEDRMRITYCIADSFREHKAKMIRMMEIATGDWEASAHVKFIYHPEEDSRCDQNNENVVFNLRLVRSKRVPFKARAFFPYNPRVDRQVQVRIDVMEEREEQSLGILTHELGHVLGFRHEHIHPDIKDPCTSEGNPFDPITDYDPSSVMHYARCDGAPGAGLRISEKDRIGAQILYPRP